MTDSEEFFVRVNGSEETLECAFAWQGLPSGSVAPFPIGRFSWSEAAKAFFDRIHYLAKATDAPEGRELPYSALRATLQARITGMLLMQYRMLRTKDDRPLFVAGGPSESVLKEANRAVAAWCQVALLPWAEKLAIDVRDVVALEARAREGGVVVEMPGADIASDGTEPKALTSDFHEFSDPMLAIAASRLDGVELFPGLGPVYRIVDGEYGNSIQFETWPVAGPRGDDLFSMFAVVSVEIQVIRLRPWARSYLGSRLESLQLPIDLIDQIRKATGCWSEMVSPLMDRIGERPSEASAIVAQEGNTRDAKKFDILLNENISYGFRRNLFGLKLPGFLLNAVIVATCLAVLYHRWPVDLSNRFDAKLLAVVVIAVLHAIYLALFVTEAGVFEAARTYARQLLLCTQSPHLGGTPRPRATARQPPRRGVKTEAKIQEQ